jgi:hypothetical protein
MMTTLPETPCENRKKKFHQFLGYICFLAIHKMTERTLAASPNLDDRQSPTSTQVHKILSKLFDLFLFYLADFTEINTWW